MEDEAKYQIIYTEEDQKFSQMIPRKTCTIAQWRVAMMLFVQRALLTLGMLLYIFLVNIQRKYEDAGGELQLPLTPEHWKVIHATLGSLAALFIALTLIKLYRKRSEKEKLLSAKSVKLTFSSWIIFFHCINISWCVCVDEAVRFEFPYLAGILICLLAVIVCKCKAESGSYKEEYSDCNEKWLTESVSAGGFAFYGTWSIGAPLLSLTVIVLYSTDPAYHSLCTWISIAILSVDLVFWPLFEIYIYQTNLLRTYSMYFTTLAVAFGVLLKHSISLSNIFLFFFLMQILVALTSVVFIVIIKTVAEVYQHSSLESKPVSIRSALYKVMCADITWMKWDF